MKKEIRENIKSNYHTHTFLCKHAIGDVEDYVKRAIDLGYHTIAITDHGPFPKFLQKRLHSRRMSFEQYEEIYLDHLNRAKKEHSNEIRILTGLEIEYMNELKLYYNRFLSQLDFLILGQHYIKIGDEYVSVFEHMLSDEEIEIYTKTVVEGMNSKQFKILAHPEIFSWDIIEWNEKCQEAAKRIIASSIQNDVILEINVNGVRNSIYQGKEITENNRIVNCPYPRKEFWKLAGEMNAKVMINDDAHSPNRICDEYTELVYEEVLKYGKINLVDRL